ncbi:MAG: DNA polymerase III subunit epsilon [Myxococcota bacterium]
MKPLYVVCDIEADGPIPGPHSMISLGAVATWGDHSELDSFTLNLAPLPGAQPYGPTLRWFTEEAPEAWAWTQNDPKPPEEAIRAFMAWVLGLPGPRVFVAHPAGFDYMWVRWYIYRYAAAEVRSPTLEPLFLDGALDLPSLAMGLLDRPFSQSFRPDLPAAWLGGHAHSHKAIDDARGYAHLLSHLLDHRRHSQQG